jgi:hypothetical protein
MGRKLNYHASHRCQDTSRDTEGGKNGIEMWTVRLINFSVRQAEIMMKKKSDKNLDENSDGWEPPWMDSSNDRKTPYTTEEELEQFAEGFISSIGDTEILKSMIEKEGKEKVMEVVKERFRKRDERNLVNMIMEGSVH